MCSSDLVAKRVAERAARLVPDAKIIYLVREPLSRLRSHFLMLHRSGWQTKSLARCLGRRPEPRFLQASLYATQLAEWTRCFPAERILVIESSALETRRQETLRRVFAFLGVNPDFRSVLFRHRQNVTRHQVHPSALGRRILRSLPMRVAARVLPNPLFYHLRNVVLAPFSGASPDMTLTADVEAALRDRLRDEVARLRAMTGEELPGLG